MSGDIRGVTLNEFAIVPSVHDDSVVLRLTGTGDVVAVNALQECLATLERAIAMKQLTALEFDMRELILLNSSCLKVFASFLIALVSSDTSCHIHFVVDSRQPWQARSLFALERLASHLVTIVPR